MPSWNQPNNSEPAHVDLLDQVRDRDTYAATWTQAGGSWSDLPIGLMQWDNGQNVIRRFNGTSFEVQQIGIAGGGTGASTAAGARANLGVLQAGTGGTQARTNDQNDGRFVQGQAGTAGTEFRNNSQSDTHNDTRYVQGQAGTAGAEFRNNTQADTQTNTIIDSRKSDATNLNDSTKLATSAAVNALAETAIDLTQFTSIWTGSSTGVNFDTDISGGNPGAGFYLATISGLLGKFQIYIHEAVGSAATTGNAQFSTPGSTLKATYLRFGFGAAAILGAESRDSTGSTSTLTLTEIFKVG